MTQRTVAATCFALFACGRPDAPAERVAFVERDSAGVGIVENHADTANLPRLVIDSPALRLGAVEGAPEEEFGHVEAAALLRGERVLVADGQLKELRLFSSDGTHIVSFGRRGEGPGEFQQIYSVAVRNDSITVWDTLLHRVSVFDATGQFVTSARIYPPTVERAGPPRSVRLRPVIRAEQGGWLSVAYHSGMVVDVPRPQAITDSVAVYWHDSTGSPARLLAAGGEEQIVYPADSFPARVQYAVPFAGLKTYAALSPDRFVMARSDEFRIQVFGADGMLQLVILYPRLVRELLAEELAERLERALASATTDERRVALQHIFDPELNRRVRPTLSGLILDDDGYVWIREWAPRPDAPTRWLVFDTTGAARFVAEVPQDAILADVNRDSALLITRDELGVSYVELRPWIMK